MHLRLNRTFQLIQEADYIIVGAGAGLSAAAGFDYSGKRFNDIFLDFKDKYRIEDMYSGSFYSFSSEEEKWAYWARNGMNLRKILFLRFVPLLLW